MSIKLNLKYTLISVVSFLVAFLTLTGDMQKYIKFAGPLNEMAFCIFAAMLGLFSIAGAIESSKLK